MNSVFHQATNQKLLGCLDVQSGGVYPGTFLTWRVLTVVLITVLIAVLNTTDDNGPP